LQVALQPLLTHVAVPLATAGQTLLHEPQWLTSLVASTHAEPQPISGWLHWKPHAPVHTGLALLGGVQTVPHLPQLDVSLPRSTQELPHMVFEPQSSAHLPDWHTCAAVQALPQVPQFSASDCVSTQAPPQLV
jgi:hypothetical protein